MSKLKEIYHERANGRLELATALLLIGYGMGNLLFPTNSIHRMALMILVGLLRLFALHLWNYQWRVASSLATMVTWLYLFLWALLLTQQTPRVAVFFTLFLTECWTLFRIRKH